MNANIYKRIKEIVVWKPQPRQQFLLSCPAMETFFGGAKGGGKTDGMLGDFLAHAARYGNHAVGIFLRKSSKELEDAIERSKQIYQPLGAVWKEAKATWRFPNGAILRMRQIERDSDAQKYQGQSYSWICVDELGNYATPYIYNQMLSCLRSPWEEVICQMRASGNPGGPGHAWVKRRFIDKKQPDHIYSYPIKVPNYNDDGVFLNYIEIEFTRCFIPSKIQDNIKLMKADPSYYARLSMLPEALRRAFLFGDWNVFVGQAFQEINAEKHYIENMLIPASWTRFATLDWGYAKPYSIGFWAVSPYGRLIRMAEDYGCVDGMENEGVRLDATAVGKKVMPVINMMGIKRVYADPACWQKHGHGKGGLSIASLLKSTGMPLVPANNDRIASITTIHNMLQQELEDGYPMLQVMKDTCPDWIRTVPNLVGSKNNIEDVDTDGEDHPYDDTRFAVMAPEVVSASRQWLNKIPEMNRYQSEERDYAV